MNICPLCQLSRHFCTCRPDDVYGPEPYRSHQKPEPAPPGEQPATEPREALRKAVASVLGKGKGSIVWDNSPYAKGYCNAITAALTAFDDECKRIDAAIAKAEAPQTAQPQQSPILEHAHAAAHRLLATEAEVLAMPKEQVDWFMGKPGHSDAFDLARFVLSLKTPQPETPAGSNAGEPQKREKSPVTAQPVADKPSPEATK